jgi:two-component system CheB/CheR fusion protein
MQSAVQQFSFQAGALLARLRQQISIIPARFGAHRCHDCSAINETGIAADEQIKMFNGLLQTVSRKLLGKIRELDCVSGELSNLMKVCATPAIFVDDKLAVRSFTPESRQVYELSHQDIGRSLLDVPCGLNYDGLEDDFQNVAATGKSVTRYLEKHGCEDFFLIRILPNFCRDNSFGGAALVFSQVAGGHWGTA